MAPPTNTTSATAIVIPSLDYTNIQTGIHDAGTTFTVWYRYTPVGADGIIGLRFYGDPIVYKPNTEVFIDNDTTSLGSIGSNLMSQIPTLTGRILFFKVIPNGGNPNPATLNVSILRAQNNLSPVGSIFIRAASILPSFITAGYAGLGAGYINDNTGIILKFSEQLPPGESGDYLPTTGEILFGDEFIEFDRLKLYSSSLVLKANIVYDWKQATPIIRTSRETKKFYIGSKGSAPTFPIEYVTVDSSGILSSPVVMVGFGITAIANSHDNLSVYVAGVGGSVGAAIKKWNKAGAAFGADFAAGVANKIVQDLLVMKNGEVVALYHESATDDIFVRVYSSAGAILNTFTAPVVPYTFVSPRLGYANDDSISFWLFLHQSDTFSRFINIKLSDVSILRNFTTPDFSYLDVDQGVSPTFRFVTSDSCPFVLSLAVNKYSGLYFVEIDKTDDTVIDGGVELDLKIPDPFIKTAFVGD